MKNTQESLVKKYVDEFKVWRDDLKKYWKQMDKNQELYEFYKREDPDTSSDLSLNTAFSIIESYIAKTNDSVMNVSVRARGQDGLEEFEKWVSTIVKDAIDDVDVAQIYGSYRKAREQWLRSYLVVGNAAAQVHYCYKTINVGGKKKVVADNPYVEFLNYKSVIFNPAYNFSTSPIYYIEKWVNYKDLKAKEYTKSGKGIYFNLSPLKKYAEDNNKLIDDTEQSFIAGRDKYSRRVEQIHIIERYEGARMTVIADDKFIIADEIDRFKTGWHNLLLGMNCVVGNRQYAYGEIDAIYEPTRAQDTILSQNIEIIKKYLRPSVLVDPESQTDLDSLIILLEEGGVMEGRVRDIGEVQVQLPPSQAFQTVDVLQQAIERAARYSPYASGMPSQQTDKTQGTLGGIQSLQRAAEPNFKVKLDDLHFSFLRPSASIYLKMIANFMSPDDVRYGLLEGQTKQWVSATKDMLLGKATLDDFVKIGYLDETEALAYQTTYDEGTDSFFKIPEADKALVFDVDWLVDISLDDQTEVDKRTETERKLNWIRFSQELGVQFNAEKTSSIIGREIGIENPEDMFSEQQLPPEMPAQMAPQMQSSMPVGGGQVGEQAY